MIGRLRFTVDETVENMKKIWETMALTKPATKRLLNRNSKVANSDGLSSAIRDIVETRDRRCGTFEGYVHNNFNGDLFASDSRLCRT